jgi:hypothetical protein
MIQGHQAIEKQIEFLSKRHWETNAEAVLYAKQNKLAGELWENEQK